MFTNLRVIFSLVVCLTCLLRVAEAADWPMLGRTASRNAVSPESGGPLDWHPGALDAETGERTGAGARNVKWVAELGSLTYGDPVVASGLVWVGTNNHSLTEEREDASVLMCFRERDGELLYKYVSPRLPYGRRFDWPYSSLGCSPLIEDDRMWFTTNRGEIVCLGIGPLIRSKDKADRTPQDEPRVVWKVDMIKDLGVAFRGTPMGLSHFCSPAGYKDWIYVITGNGVPYDAQQVPAPDAPSLLCIEKKTGKIVWSDNSPGANLLSGQWVSPLVMEIGGRAQCIAPQGDGWVRSFAAESGELLWEFDMNRKESKWSLRGGDDTRNSILATPVYYDGHIYLASGRHPEHFYGPGRLVCIDATKSGDISSELAVDADGNRLGHRRLQAVDSTKGERAIRNPNSGLVWEFTRQGDDVFLDEMHRSIASVAAADGLVIAVDMDGAVHCLDATTGKKYWSYDLLAMTLAAPLIVDGRVYVGDEDGHVAVFRLSRDPNVAMQRTGDEWQPIAEVHMGTSVHCSPIFANGTLYLAMRSHLFAIQETGEEQREQQAVARAAAAMGEWKQWRGPDRANKSPETGLLTEWPEGGPPLVWRVDGLGHGIASVSIAKGRIYTSTYRNDIEIIVALDQRTGRLIWATPIGRSVPEIPLMRWLSQRTPTLDDDRLYILSAEGVLFCLDTTDGSERWRKSYDDDFQAQAYAWGFCDYPLVDGDRLICTPGGAENTVVALDKYSGSVIWTSPFQIDYRPERATSYSALLAAELGGIRQYISHFTGALAGFAATDGTLLWQYDGFKGNQNALTPIVYGEQLFAAGGHGDYGAALLAFVPSAARLSVHEEYFKEIAINHFQDNLVRVGDHVYATGRTLGYFCLDIRNGQIVWQQGIPAAGQRRGSRRSRLQFVAMTYAEDHLYVRRSDDHIGLIEASPEAFANKSSFVLPDPAPAIGATAPVIAGGHLYIRDDERMFAYDIRRSAINSPAPEPRTVTFDLSPLALRFREQELDAKTRPGPRSVFVPTPQDVVEKMLEVAEVKQDDVVYDLGSGDGRIVITAAKKYGSRAVGVEIDAELVEVSRAKANEAGVGELVAIEQKDVFGVDLSEANVVAIYLLPTQLEKLVSRLEKLPPGARIVSHQFEIPGHEADRTVRVTSDEDGAEHTIYLWTTPLKRE